MTGAGESSPDSRIIRLATIAALRSGVELHQVGIGELGERHLDEAGAPWTIVLRAREDRLGLLAA